MAKQTSSVEQALARVERLTPEALTRTSRQLVHVEKEIKHGATLLDNLFGIEEPSRGLLKQNLAEFRLGHAKLESQVALGEQHQLLLSLEPLTWRDAKGWPRLAVFSLESPRFELSVACTARWENIACVKRVFPKLPRAIAGCFDDVLDSIAEKEQARNRQPGSEWSVNLACQFGGLIPLPVKEKIVEAADSFEDIFIIGEPHGWTLKKTAVVLPKRDPLVVGWDGVQLWLIAAFDTTPVEEAMIFEIPKKGRD